MRRRAAPAVLTWLALLAVLLGAGRAHARDLSTSYSTWILSGRMITLRYILPAAQAQRLTGSAMPLVTVSKLESYMLDHVEVTAAGQSCPVTDQGYDLGLVDPLNVGTGRYGFEIFFDCENPVGIELHDHVLFDQVPWHVTFARIQKGGHFSEQLFTATRQRLVVPDRGFVPDAGVSRYAGLGWRHLGDSLDRWCFLFGVLLLARRRADVGYAVAGLAIGYALSLAQSLGGWFTPRLPLLEAFIGFLVALPVLQRLALEQVRPQRIAAVSASLLALLALVALPLRGASPALVLAGASLLAASSIASGPEVPKRPLFWLLPAAVFGFLDGCVLPAALVQLQLQPQLPARALAPMLAGFDLGAAALGAFLLLAIAGAFAWLWQRRWLPPRAVVCDVAAAALGGLGVFWLVSRVYG